MKILLMLQKYVPQVKNLKIWKQYWKNFGELQNKYIHRQVGHVFLTFLISESCSAMNIILYASVLISI